MPTRVVAGRRALLGAGVALAALGALAAGGCSAPPAPTDLAAPRGDRAPAGWEPPFLVRGRLDAPADLAWRTDGTGGPVDAATLSAAARAAGDAWSGTPGLGFREAAAGEAPDVEISWRTPQDDPCGLFGSDASLAHTGPFGRPAFVHLDASRRWTLEAGSGDERLDAALAHEFGHVLGLDHAPCAGALMSFDSRLAAPAPPDLAGVQSLYGGGTDAPGDVQIRGADVVGGPGGAGVAGVAALRAVAPPERTALALFDTDGDGADELLVWRTDREGLGALVVYRFARAAAGAATDGPRLAGTDGPWLDVVPPGALSSLRVDGRGRRWLITREGADERVRGFDDAGRLRRPDVAERLALDVDALLALPAPPVLSRAEDGLGPAHATDGTPAGELSGDFDGDGRPERVTRVPRAPAAAAPPPPPPRPAGG